MNPFKRLRLWARWLQLGMLATAGYSGYGFVGEFVDWPNKLSRQGSSRLRV